MNVLLHGVANGFTGYGQFTQDIIEGFVLRDHKVSLKAFSCEERLPLRVLTKAAIETKLLPDVEIIITSPYDTSVHWLNSAAKRKFVFTMWETSKLPKKDVVNFNAAGVPIIVPTEWNRIVFIKSGIKVPIYVCPLGINTDKFPYAPSNSFSKFTVGVVGRIANFPERKRVADLCTAFTRAFPRNKDVSLKVKVFEDCESFDIFDNRINVDKSVATSLVNFYGQIDVLASLSIGEGWGLPMHEAMATGRPSILPDFGGTQELATAETAYLLPYQLTQAPAKYYDCVGKTAYASIESMAEMLQHVYSNRVELVQKGLYSHRRANLYTTDRMVETLLNIIQ